MGPSHPETPCVCDCSSDDRGLDEFNPETCAMPAAPVLAPANTSLLMFASESGETLPWPRPIPPREATLDREDSRDPR